MGAAAPDRSSLSLSHAPPEPLGRFVRVSPPRPMNGCCATAPFLYIGIYIPKKRGKKNKAAPARQPIYNLFFVEARALHHAGATCASRISTGKIMRVPGGPSWKIGESRWQITHEMRHTRRRAMPSEKRVHRNFTGVSFTGGAA